APLPSCPTRRSSDLVQAKTLEQCDALDGVKDGVAEDPRRCTFDPASLSCPAGTDGGSCLTPPQVAAVKKIMAGPRNPHTGEQIRSEEHTSELQSRFD